MPDVVITGLGVTSAIGQGKEAFMRALVAGEHRFDFMQRPGRQDGNTQFIGAEITNFSCADVIAKSQLRTASLSAQIALTTLYEAWGEACLDEVDPARTGLIVGGNNVQQRELLITQEKYRKKSQFLSPAYGLSFLDTDLCGLCSAAFGIQGFAYTLGGASASGQLAVINAVEAVESGRVDICIALGAMMDISYWECHGLRGLGAMGSDRYLSSPELACRPFDRQHDGFIYGENCAALVIERAETRPNASLRPYAKVVGKGVYMDANRQPNPSLNGEITVIRQALREAKIVAEQVDYVNPHGTGSVVGDEIELQALTECGLSHAAINTTKSITGHGLTAAGAVEITATLLQMREGILHPTRNLENPIDNNFAWVGNEAEESDIQTSLCMSMGFGGINTALCLRNSETN
ncbi:beta-ketoacyl synthase N-terminal-like domain-containing protein [Microbulbifer sp. ZKSA006]|uniref:beta-ketoacyl synthase N-terminal-like domain-containing protein n=1 Tax=Microbulbifer sp. ZKSA006 TaxID=3243390 RepID=UPI00403A0E04